MAAGRRGGVVFDFTNCADGGVVSGVWELSRQCAAADWWGGDS